ncbi:unnamed protein product [Arabidopsis thaliana]|uniref:Reverse transcriptase zinc-binding domain-containing protein n=1 Tax=Arabidopsis thaliana TaxID=3702 RepID=A0A654FLP9_ARATH|nr:unnamed protein product [Arabidopsis thaliana]
MLNWNVVVDYSCVLCRQPLESRGHLFFTCLYSAEIWTALTCKLLTHKFTTYWDSIIKLLTDRSLGLERLFLTRYTFQLTLHSIWKERNGRRHGEMHASSAQQIRVLDKPFRNRVSSIGEQGDKRYDACMQVWFGSR